MNVPGIDSEDAEIAYFAMMSWLSQLEKRMTLNEAEKALVMSSFKMGWSAKTISTRKQQS